MKNPNIRKPPKAFMLFMKEQRPVPPELQKQGSAAVNAAVGKMVTVLYFSEAMLLIL